MRDRDNMKRVYYFLNTGLCFWGLALISWSLYATPWAIFPAVLALVAFLLHSLQKRVFTIFGKNKPTMVELQNTVAVTPTPVEKETPREEKQSNTVISHEVRFEGKIIATGQVYIYGQVVGNIESTGGIIKIMRNGLVEGNISCRELIVDGTVSGECKSESIDIYENGRINGAMSYSALAIKKGGAFVGHSSLIPVVEKKTNVVELAAEKISAVTPENIAAAEKSTAQSPSPHAPDEKVAKAKQR